LFTWDRAPERNLVEIRLMHCRNFDSFYQFVWQDFQMEMVNRVNRIWLEQHDQCQSNQRDCPERFDQ
jgi:hypothetical protein